MITLNFQHSPDPTLTGEMKTFYDELAIGKGRTNDLILLDQGVRKSHVLLTIRQGQLFAISMDDEAVFHLNGKKTKGTLPVNKGAVLKIGETSFKVINFETSAETQKSLADRYHEAIEADPDLESLFKDLEKELLIIEQKMIKS